MVQNPYAADVSLLSCRLLPLIFSAGHIYKFSVFLYILPQNRWRSPSNQAEREEDDKQKILNSNLIYLISSV
jgi:hypothetical protein